MIVIADDITGAAELAGIAWRQGFVPHLVCGCDTVTNSHEGILVIATDTRSCPEDEAVAELCRLASHITPLAYPLFKKTDSALRGHVVREISTLLEATDYKRAVYLPANPSKNRIIRQGVYYIDGVPIHQTAFSYDPEFPAKSSKMSELFPDAEAHHIVMPDAQSLEDIRRIVATYNDGRTLFAGAADLFRMVLDSNTTTNTTNNNNTTNNHSQSHPTDHQPTAVSDTLILCGSTQSRPLNIGLPIAPMPQAIYDGSDDLSLWDVNGYEEGRGLILTIPYSHRTGHVVANHLRQMMAATANRLIEQHPPGHLMIEGGATAWATLQSLGWHSFTIEREFAPGIVQMRASNGTLITLKPGSYPWEGLSKLILFTYK